MTPVDLRSAGCEEPWTRRPRRRATNATPALTDRLPERERAGTPAAGCVVALRHVSRRYGATVALDDLTLELSPGTVHAVIGENGAGKSTAAKIAAGVVQASSGGSSSTASPSTSGARATRRRRASC